TSIARRARVALAIFYIVTPSLSGHTAELIPEGQGAEYPLLPPSLVQHYSVGYDVRTPSPPFVFSAHCVGSGSLMFVFSSPT
ncbi:hypothetical protein, partial [Ferrimicrobium sp.]|uniref:hypothetical protein n=1 Tax=Ferrimicrobium sp. TaxID=2926050 RepID=UPI002610A53C